MKRSIITRAPLLLALLALLGATMMASTPPRAAAQASGSVTPNQGAPGTTFVVRVAGLKPNEQVGTWLNQPDGRQRDATPYLKADMQGVATWSWASPADAPAGRWQAVTRGRTSGVEVVLDLTLSGTNTAPGAPVTSGSVSPTSGPIGTVFRFFAEGFAPGEAVPFWPTGPDGTPLASANGVLADAAGRIGFEWQAPARAQPGQWVMTARGDSSRAEAMIPFVVSPSDATPLLTASPPSGAPGTAFSLRANGFNDGERLDTWIEGPNGQRYNLPEGAKADKKGVAIWTWMAPADVAGGTWAAYGRGQDTRFTLRGTFTIVRDSPPPSSAPPASVSPERGGPGTTFTFRAGGYERGEKVGYWLTAPDRSIVRFDQELRGDKEGFVTVSWTAPANAQRGNWMMVMRSSQSDRNPNDVSHQIGFVVE